MTDDEDLHLVHGDKLENGVQYLKQTHPSKKIRIFLGVCLFLFFILGSYFALSSASISRKQSKYIYDENDSDVDNPENDLETEAGDELEEVEEEESDEIVKEDEQVKEDDKQTIETDDSSSTGNEDEEKDDAATSGEETGDDENDEEDNENKVQEFLNKNEDFLSEHEQAEKKEPAAPRSMPELTYNEMDFKNHRYLIYSPSGGMSNQEMELANAMEMAHLLKRTLYLPMIGKHSDLVHGYQVLKYYDLFPADRVFDVKLMSKLCRVIPLNRTVTWLVTTFIKTAGAKNVRLFVTSPGLDGDLVAKHLKSSAKYPLIFFNGKNIWHRWFTVPKMGEIRKFMGYSPYLRQLSLRIAKAELGERFYAIHGRLGDLAYRWGGKNSGAVFVRTTEFRSWNKKLKLYLATDEPNSPFFNDLRKAIVVLTGDDLKGRDVQEFRNLFEDPNMQRDMFGVIDKLMCAQAIGFLGSSFSTFTNDIWRVRGHIKYVFPELHELRNRNISSP